MTISRAQPGCASVAYAALRHPERLTGLFLLNAPMGVWRGKNRTLMRLAGVLLRLFGPRSFAALMIAKSAPDRAALVELIVAAMGRCDRGGLVRAVRHAIDREDLIPLLPGLRVPAVIFAAADDELLPVDEARAQAAVIPLARFVVVERSSHQSALEAPAQVLPVLLEMLAAWSAPAAHESARTIR